MPYLIYIFLGKHQACLEHLTGQKRLDVHVKQQYSRATIRPN